MRKNDAFVAKIVNTRLTKIFMAIFAPDERLPSSATLLDTWWGPQWGKSKSFSNFPTIFLPTSIRVEDLKDPAQLLLGSAHHHRKLRLNTLYFFQSPFSLISSTLWQCNCQNYSHVLLKVHAPTIVLVEHPVHRVTQDASLCDNNHCHHFFHIINIFLLSNASPPSRQRTASSRWLPLDISPWTWDDRFASLN